MEDPSENRYPVLDEESKKQILDQVQFMHENGFLRPAPEPEPPAPTEEDEDEDEDNYYANWPSGPWLIGNSEDDETAPDEADEI